MTRTFLVTVELPDDGSTTLQELAEDIEDVLESIIDVHSVKPWSSPTDSFPVTPTEPPTL